MFGSAYVKVGIWPIVGLQALFMAGQAYKTPQPSQIKSVEITGSNTKLHEPN